MAMNEAALLIDSGIGTPTGGPMVMPSAEEYVFQSPSTARTSS